jgi:demethylmenaquinone methyltransferase/2-methoxy-6-polyprenyl-1,4-benzoquinol methylase
MPDKTPSFVSGFYDGIFRYYETANTILTFGLDAYWRNEAARIVLAARPDSCLDVCTGTGGLAVLIHKLSEGRIKVTGLDFNESMLSAARAKTSRIVFIRGDAGTLPFPDETFDALTVSFAARNLDTGRAALITIFKEFQRVLKPGGIFVNLETSQPENIFIKKVFHLYVKIIAALVAALFPGSRSAYSFLAGTIRGFYTAETLSTLLIEAGFARVRVSPSLLGAVALHKAVK